MHNVISNKYYDCLFVLGLLAVKDEGLPTLVPFRRTICGEIPDHPRFLNDYDSSLDPGT